MHEQLAARDSPYARDLEGSYLSATALRRYDSQNARHPNSEHGESERLKMREHRREWDIHRFVLREGGIRLFGPDVRTLVDPVSPAELRAAVCALLEEWGTEMPQVFPPLCHRGYQSYVVLSMCRGLYTL